MAGLNLRSSRPAYPTQPTHVSTSILPPDLNLRSTYRPPPFQANASSTSMAAPLSNASILPQGKLSSEILSKPPSKASELIFSNEKESKFFQPPGRTSSLRSKEEQKLRQIQDPSFSPPERKAQKLTDDDLERKSHALLKEYFHLRDLNEARQCVEDLDSPRYHAQFLFQAISMALEHTELHVQMVVELIHHLFSQKTLTKVDIRDGFLMIAGQCDDLAIDIPLAPKYVGELFGKSAMNGTVVDLTLLYDVLQKVEDTEIRKKILDTAVSIMKSDARGKELLRVQEAELSKSENLTEEPPPHFFRSNNL